MEYKEFGEVFSEEGITQEKIINRLWVLRLGNYSFSDNFETKEELKQAIREFREFLFQFLYSDSPV